MANHPELRDEAESIPTALAGDIQTTVMELGSELFSGRTGHQPGLGWVQPYDVADEIVAEVVEPFLADAVRRAQAGATDAAVTMSVDIIEGLHSLPLPTELDSTMVYSFCAEDSAYQWAQELIGRLREAGVALPEATLAETAPDWFDLTQADIIQRRTGP
ncbi:hypothetical protein ACFXJ8_17990 [Nonomuraea sp. NPDC059194]|uniref:hypothetical protein n=1 Tax=Nonomuraea sp. NPDC059194 TaxID=3346764 RepID=UPI0036B60491